MTNPEAIATDYLAAWNQGDPARRLDQMAARWTDDAAYADPLMAANGRTAICEMIEKARGQFPGHAFALRGKPDSHGSFVRFSWDLAPTGGAPIAGGTDVVRLDGQGRIAEVVGFLDHAPGA
ncbi:MAG TPA: nuclear transport factor 2 family protein [Phenylobacterium sp.]|nr:nuclear transport factor 2 family protein [Phenylobacterium sp.]